MSILATDNGRNKQPLIPERGKKNFTICTNYEVWHLKMSKVSICRRKKKLPKHFHPSKSLTE